MPKRDTEGFLRWLNEQNDKIAAKEAKPPEGVGVDPIREQREAERRERLGQLRAREHSGRARRGRKARNVFGYSDPS